MSSDVTEKDVVATSEDDFSKVGSLKGAAERVVRGKKRKRKKAMTTTRTQKKKRMEKIPPFVISSSGNTSFSNSL